MANENRNRLSDAEEREQMMLALAIENDGDGKGGRIINRELSERWPDGDIPYILSCSYDAADRGVIATALDHIEKNSCVKFRYANVEDREFITINNTQIGCFVKGRG